MLYGHEGAGQIAATCQVERERERERERELRSCADLRASSNFSVFVYFEDHLRLIS